MKTNNKRNKLFDSRFAAIILGAVTSFATVTANANDFIYRGKVHCQGPYHQSQLNLPDDWIQITVQWDPIFNNSDISFQVGNSAPSVAVTRLYFYESLENRNKAYSGVFLLNGEKYTLSIGEREKAEDGKEILTGYVEKNGTYHFLKCEETP